MNNMPLGHGDGAVSVLVLVVLDVLVTVDVVCDVLVVVVDDVLVELVVTVLDEVLVDVEVVRQPSTTEKNLQLFASVSVAVTSLVRKHVLSSKLYPKPKQSPGF